ncbi:TMF family protein [Spirosoma sp. KNUC1025]|uniref:TMF family protein n=1 Tax=Spirosoma sp. KNUC1025 TaxID=2894082 RepID=UPI00386E92A3|nr:TMF family protein [Spirosoma sp. KNUC1025]
MIFIRSYVTIIAFLPIILNSVQAQNNILFINKNVAAGNGAGSAITAGVNNVFVGYQAGRANTTGTGNTFLGFQSGYNNTTGIANVFIGSQAGQSNTTGIGNMFLGQLAGTSNSTGSYNLLFGNSTGQAITIGSGNTAMGDGALLNNTDGTSNTAVGRYAGLYNNGMNNVFIGNGATVAQTTPTITNATAIGSQAQVSKSNSVVLGNNANVGIGTTAPNAKLEVVSGTSGVSGLRLTSLGTNATLLSQTKFLTVNASGDVVLGSINGSARSAANTENSWQTNGENLQNTNTGGVVIGPGVNRTPSGYRLYVADGVLTEKVKVAVKSTDDWSDKVFEKTYHLNSLKTVEQYIEANKHLPGVPSAEEVVRQGLDVAKMDAKLLEKIEELTLYSIQLQHELNAVKQQRQQDQLEIQSMKEKQAQLVRLVEESLKRK